VEQHELRPPRGARKPRKRIGRGNASGHGTYSGRGIKGQQSRAGSHVRPGFEGGQTPLIRRLPRRRGFHNPFRVAYTPVNLRDLSKFSAGSEVTPESLRESRIVRSLRRPIKVLGDGELTAALTVRAHRVSSAARAKIESAGGTVEELTPRPAKADERQPEQARKTKKEAPKAENESATEPGPEQEEEDDSGSESGKSGSAD
jgi:large subunit ribosomal protein L15